MLAVVGFVFNFFKWTVLLPWVIWPTKYNNNNINWAGRG